MAEDPDLEMWAMRALGNRLRDARLQAELTLPKAAERAGVGAPYLSDLERGRKLPKLLTLSRIAAAYNLLAVDLLADTYPFGSAQRPRQLPAPPADGRRDRNPGSAPPRSSSS